MAKIWTSVVYGILTVALLTQNMGQSTANPTCSLKSEQELKKEWYRVKENGTDHLQVQQLWEIYNSSTSQVIIPGKDNIGASCDATSEQRNNSSFLSIRADCMSQQYEYRDGTMYPRKITSQYICSGHSDCSFKMNKNSTAVTRGVCTHIRDKEVVLVATSQRDGDSYCVYQAKLAWVVRAYVCQLIGYSNPVGLL